MDNTLYGTFAYSTKQTHAGMWNDCSYGKLQLNGNSDAKINSVPSGNDIFIVDVPVRCSTVVGNADYNVHCAYDYNMQTTCDSNEFCESRSRRMKKKRQSSRTHSNVFFLFSSKMALESLESTR